MKNDEYRQAELARCRAQVASTESKSLADRKICGAAYAALLRDPDMLKERVTWLLAGNYGLGSVFAAQDILSRPRMNRGAALGVLLAALECGCPAREARQAWLGLPAGARQAVTAVMEAKILDAFEEM